MNWRRINRAVHRDLGYLCAGLSIVYALTGVLLNHLHDWNPNWKIVRSTAKVGAPPPPERFMPADLEHILAELGEREQPVGSFFRSPTTLQVFFEGGRMITVDIPTGQVSGETVRPRTILSFLDNLHLNRAGAAWTWLADGYAAALTVLAITGLFVLKGTDGITRRGAALVMVGIALPAALLWLSR